MADEVGKITRARGRVKASVTRLATWFQTLNVDAITSQDLRVRVRALEDDNNEFYRLQSKLNDVATDDMTAAMEKEEADFQERFFDLSAKLKLLIDQKINVGRDADPGANNQQQRPHCNVKLPRITLPKFSGRYEDWTSFRDLFTASIHNNAGLSGAEKLQYLNGALEDEPRSLIKSIPINDASYDEAWNILTDRYDNKHLIVQSLLRPLFSYPPVKTEGASELRKLLDAFVEKTRSLKVLGLPVDQCDFMLVYMITDKLDSESRKQWELTLKANQLPTFNEIKEFLESRCRALEAASSATKKNVSTSFKPNTTPKPSSSGSSRTTASHFSSQELTCAVCGQLHKIHKCDQFQNYTISQRKETVKRNKLCFNCLAAGHSVNQCTSRFTCRLCNYKHHSLLHQDIVQHQVSSLETQVEDSPAIVSVTSNVSMEGSSSSQVLLSTALVKIEDSKGYPQICRVLLDSGSQATFITPSCANRLGLKRKTGRVQITGVGQTGAGSSVGTVQIKFSSMNSDFTSSAEALIMDKITGALPNSAFNKDEWNHLKTLKLADPLFHKPSPIDILLGADVFAHLIIDGKICGPQGSPIAQNTQLGWILSGRMKSSRAVKAHTITVLHSSVDTDLDSTLKRFWEVEETAASRPPQSLEEKRCEEHFMRTYSREEDGRYVVRLPFKDGELGDSLDTAISRLHQIERRLQRQPEYLHDYHKFMQEYLDMGHMEELTPEEIAVDSNKSYYLPHHFVLKSSSTTTKFRVVFDASRATKNGRSLNDCLMVGPKLQDDLIPLILRIRTHKIAFTADIAKMYRQVSVHPDDRDYQRIVWRFNPTDPVKHYRLKTVTYGTASAPYQATKCLQQLAEELREEYPLGAEVALRDFFVDDIMSGASDVQTALKIQSELNKLLERGQFPLRKYASNSKELLEAIPEALRETKVSLEIGVNDSVKALGIDWYPEPDYYAFKIVLPTVSKLLTKRTVLSDIARIFDPIGWLAPVIVVAKLLMQKMWILGLRWDEEISEELANRWLEFRESLQTMEEVQIPRWVMSGPDARSTILLGFSDASEVAYSAVVYLRVEDCDGNIHCMIVTAKTKVAPIKTVSLPRLELLGATLLARLIVSSRKAMMLTLDDVYAWSDSTITLAWIRGHPNRWKTFVSNRVSEIQDAVPPQNWMHVKSEDNPADCASRGLSPNELSSHPLWWHGPSWLLDDPSTWKRADVPATNLEERPVKVHKTQVMTGDPTDLITRYHSLSRLQRVTAWCLRYLWNRMNPKERRTGVLSNEELNQALKVQLKKMQMEVFKEDFKCIMAGQNLHSSSKLGCLNPFVSEDGLIRVGGRLQNAKIPNDKKFPIVIPRSHPLTTLLVNYAHLKHLHAGPTLLLAVLRQQYWILCGRDVVRQHIHRCLKCFRDRATTAQQLMGQLPTHRVTPSRAFLHVGVDYAGPILLRSSKGPGRKIITKGYISVFVCFVTKAIHLEVVSDLTSASFLAALRRFVSRRGKCSDMYSDCGTNFVGANKEMKEFLGQCSAAVTASIVQNQVAMDGINWHFNPPSSPHFGGLWEAGVKSTKTHLRRVIGETVLTFEELYTVLTQIEACLNSRPLCGMSNDPSDLSALTPGHFIIGEPLTSIPEPSLLELNSNRLSRWQLLQKFQQHFWKRWHQEYLSTLQQRPKWTNSKEDFKVGDLVLVKDERLPPLKWNLGRITETFAGQDGAVRVVNVRTAQGVLKRPIVKLCPLPIQ